VTTVGVLVPALIVASLRALLETSLCAPPRAHPVAAFLSGVSFYLMAVYLLAEVGGRLIGRASERALSFVRPGLCLGVLPPLLDLAIQGVGRCRYTDPFGPGWALVPWQTARATPGETFTAWLCVALFTLGVAVLTRSLMRTLLAALAAAALLAAYAGGLGPAVTVVFEESLRPALALRAGSAASHAALLALLTVAHVVTLQLAYLAARPGLARHLGFRLLHGLPFVLLVALGAVLARLTARPTGDRIADFGLAAVAAGVIADLWLIAVIQNDHFDASDDRSRGGLLITHDEVVLFTAAGFLAASGVTLVSEGIGWPLMLFAAASVGYSAHAVRLKHRFPANYAVEGVWAASSFVAGAQGRLPAGQPFPRGLLVATAIVLSGWSVFNAFKDYKDIRADVRANVPTLYALAYHRGIRLRRLHLTLR
jgi:hypothetical protein